LHILTDANSDKGDMMDAENSNFSPKFPKWGLFSSILTLLDEIREK